MDDAHILTVETKLFLTNGEAFSLVRKRVRAPLTVPEPLFSKEQGQATVTEVRALLRRDPAAQVFGKTGPCAVWDPGLDPGTLKGRGWDNG